MGRELEVAREAAAAAGKVLMKYFDEGVQSRAKAASESYNLVSDADIAAEQAIAACIRETFPEHDILGEEEAQGSIEAEHLWIVDPLDGTNNFLHRMPHFAVSVAYYHQGAAKCGVVFNPHRQDLYWAQAGEGAYHEELRHPSPTRLFVAEAESLDKVFIGTGFYYDRGQMMQATLDALRDFFRQNVHGIRRFGTASLDLCAVAAGHYGAFFEYQLSPWDFAAGRLIVEEAGGSVTTGRGETLPLKSTSVLASNQRLHPAALEIVLRHHL